MGNDERKNLTKTQSKRHPFLMKIFLKLLLWLIILCVVCGGAYYGWKKITLIKYEAQRTLVERQLVSCSELVTLKYQYSDIITIKKTAMWSKSYSIVKYSGIVRAGIDNLEKAEYEISSDHKSITVKLPNAKILGNELVTQELFDEKQSIFIPISTQEVFDEINLSKDIALDELISQGFLTEAQNHAQNVIRQIFLGMGFENVVVL